MKFVNGGIVPMLGEEKSTRLAGFFKVEIASGRLAGRWDAVNLGRGLASLQFVLAC